MLIRKLILYLLLLCFFLTFGYWSGKVTSVKAREIFNSLWSLNSNTKDVHYPLPQAEEFKDSAQKSNAELDLGTNSYTAPIQQNILVIGVSDLTEERPQLISLWMVLYLTDSAQLTLMPIYPSFVPQNNHADRLQKAFRLNTNHTPEKIFLDALRDNNLWWDYYVVMDKYALTSLISFIQDSSQGTKSPELQTWLSGGSNDLPTALSDQTLFLQNLCDSATKMPYLPDVTSLYQLLPDHISSDLEIKQFISEWQIRLAQGGRLTCEFPFVNTR